jgi:hypothetical protein
MPPTTPIGQLVTHLREPATNQEITEAVEETVAGATAEIDGATRGSLRRITRAAAKRSAQLVNEGEYGAVRALGRDTDDMVLELVEGWSRPRDTSADSLTHPRELAARLPRG